jgi:hypothetical protein
MTRRSAPFLIGIGLVLSGGLACGAADSNDQDSTPDENESTEGGETGESSEASGDTTTADSGDSEESTADETTTPPNGDICPRPVELFDTSQPTHVIGDGSPSSCTGAALKSAAQEGGVITFNCGSAGAVIELDETINLPIDKDTIIDGGGVIVLDAQSKTRHFTFEHPDWMNNANRLVIQRMTLRNGSAPLGEYFPQNPAQPKCAYGYKEGSGGAIYMRNGTLHVIECIFEDNVAALEGPDVAGGAIYALGVPEIVVTNSIFRRNRAANGGAIGMLFANPTIFNSVFEDNAAVGIGQNYVEPGCPEFNHDEQGGAGGNSGAIVFDGLNDEDVVYEICGSTFRGNRANELGGALFRTPNAGVRKMRIDRCLFDENSARMGGVSFIKQNDVTVLGSTFSNNRSGVDTQGNEVGGPLGGLWINEGTLDLQNSTFFANQPTGLDVEGGSSTVRNATFVQSIPRGALNVQNSIFVDCACDAALDGANNLQWPQGQLCVEGTPIVDPQLGELANNGGPTPTFLPASAEVLGVGAMCPESDQRGEAREVEGCAAGAVEP